MDNKVFAAGHGGTAKPHFRPLLPMDLPPLTDADREAILRDAIIRDVRFSIMSIRWMGP